MGLPEAGHARQEAARTDLAHGADQAGRHAAMGVAMGLLFALIASLIHPSGIVFFAGDGSSSDNTVSLGALVLTFAIGATLTGPIFMMTEESDS
jgi:hypothetical protein